MVILVCGGRDYTDQHTVDQYLDQLDAEDSISTVIHGDARGADRCGHNWALKRQKLIRRFPADWDRYGKSAGYRRNAQMIADLLEIGKTGYRIAVIAFPGGAGTAHTVNMAHNAKIKVRFPS